jgi:hypothetical protein
MFDYIRAPFFSRTALEQCRKNKLSTFIWLYIVWVCILSVLIALGMNGVINKNMFASKTDIRYLVVLLRPVISGILMDVFFVFFAIVIKRYFQITLDGKEIIKIFVIGRLLLPVVRLVSCLLITPIVPIVGFVYFAVYFCWGISISRGTELKDNIGYILVCIMALVILFSVLPLVL